MAVPWYEWRNIRERLISFGKAVQGLSPYRVIIEPNRRRCPSGYCDFTRREIAANPTLFPLPPREQYQLTKAILVHEAGHRRFTDPDRSPTVVHIVANILEDERVERLMARELAGVRRLIKKLSRVMYQEAQPIDESTDSPGEVVAYFLQLRWARRIGKPIKGGLSPSNMALWERIKPLVEEAWNAPSSELVRRCAEEIVKTLKLEEKEIPTWVKEAMDRLGSLKGERKTGDIAERGCSDEAQGEEGAEEEPEPFDSEVPPNDKRLGSGDTAIEPQPYIWLEERVRPLVEELIEELSWEPSLEKPEPSERGRRLSIREYIRDRERPFLEESEKAKAPPTLALKVIIDHSTSLNVRTVGGMRIESVAEAAMMLHLVCLELGIRHEVIVTPQGFKIADLESGERGKALIAGLIPARCDYEDMGLAIKNHALPMIAYPEDIKLVVCLTDGACNDASLGREICRALRGRVEVIGILLDPDEGTRRYVAEMFGEDRLIACRSEELPFKLGNLLRAIKGT